MDDCPVIIDGGGLLEGLHKLHVMTTPPSKLRRGFIFFILLPLCFKALSFFWFPFKGLRKKCTEGSVNLLQLSNLDLRTEITFSDRCELVSLNKVS